MFSGRMPPCKQDFREAGQYKLLLVFMLRHFGPYPHFPGFCNGTSQRASNGVSRRWTCEAFLARTRRVERGGRHGTTVPIANLPGLGFRAGAG